MLYYGLLLFFVLEFLRPGKLIPIVEVLHLNSIVPLSVFLGSLSMNRVKVSETLGSTSAKWLIFMLALMLFSILVCDVKMYAISMFTAVLGACLVFFVLVREIHEVKTIKGVFKTLILVHVIAGLMTPQLFSGDGERHYIGIGAFGDGNDFSLSVNTVIPLCLFLMLESEAVTKRCFYGGVLLILILAIVATQSRGGVLALVSIGLYYWAKSKRKVLGLAGIVMIGVIVISFAPAAFFERMETMTHSGEEMEGSAQGRIQTWGAAVRMAADNPLFGVGVGHFAVKFGVEYRPEGVSRTALPWLTAHSTYFLLLGELGLPGLIFVLGIIIANVLGGERILREVRGRWTERDMTIQNLMIALNASLIAFAVGGAFLSFAYNPHIYLLAGFSECGRQICRKLLLEEESAHCSEK